MQSAKPVSKLPESHTAAYLLEELIQLAETQFKVSLPDAPKPSSLLSSLKDREMVNISSHQDEKCDEKLKQNIQKLTAMRFSLLKNYDKKDKLLSIVERTLIFAKVVLQDKFQISLETKDIEDGSKVYRDALFDYHRTSLKQGYTMNDRQKDGMQLCAGTLDNIARICQFALPKVGRLINELFLYSAALYKINDLKEEVEEHPCRSPRGLNN